MSQVPNNWSFTLQDVIDVLPRLDQLTLSDCFEKADEREFDPAYKGDMNRLRNFRNYGRDIECEGGAVESGVEGYPVTRTVNLGTDTGSVELAFDAASRPDFFRVKADNSVLLDTGWWGAPSYSFGQSNRSELTDALEGKADPVTGVIFPYDINNPVPGHINQNDGYPNLEGISDPGQRVSLFFDKNTRYPIEFTVEIYAPIEGTIWDFILKCPI